jgi:hypothetical protein
MKTIGMLALGLATVGLAAPAWATSAKDLVNEALDAHEARLANVQTVRIAQSMMGMEMTVELEKVTRDGHTTLVNRSTMVGGQKMPSGNGDESWASPFGGKRAVAEHAKLAGKEDVNGTSCHVIEVDDLAALDLAPPPGPPDQGEIVPERGIFYLGTDDKLLHRMIYHATATGPDGSKEPMTMTMTFDDYRETEGYLHPWSITMVTEGVMNAMDEDVDREELEQGLTELKAQMGSMPEGMRPMLQSQIDRLEGMLGGGGMEMQVTVTKVEVEG